MKEMSLIFARDFHRNYLFFIKKLQKFISYKLFFKEYFKSCVEKTAHDNLINIILTQ